jgi:murein DD-endopeptidase MepM/ murein hydrolase activator NlpD
MTRTVFWLAVAMLLGLGGSSMAGGSAPGGSSAEVRYAAPLPEVRVVHPFAPPVLRFGPGHVGVDLATHSGAVVRAAAAGVVSFAGRVAGRGLVVLAHLDGIRTEYEPIRALVRRGDAVARGQPIGRVVGGHHGCAPGRCLHWGARRGAVYLDPLALLRPLGPVRLLPWS